MRKFAISCIFLMLMQVAGAQSIITIDALESGDALWTVEKSMPLVTKAEIDNWNEFVNKGQSHRYNEEIRNSTDLMLLTAVNFSNRPMKAENFNISYNITKTLSGAAGIVRYSFEWKNFSSNDSSRIFIGDAFSGGMFSSNDVLIIKIPDGYEVQNVSPSFDNRDGNRLVWEGTLHSNFSKGEPALVLSRIEVTSGWGTDLAKPGDQAWEKFILPIIVVFMVGLMFVISVVSWNIWKRRRSQNLTTGKIEFYEDLLTQVPKEMVHEVLKIPGIWPKTVQFLHKELGIKSIEELEKAAREHRLSNAALTPSTDEAKEILGYEEMIEHYLIKSGGQAFQSQIVKESGLSKSKISIVLAQMKEEGRILKIRKGKENIIRLINAQDLSENI